MKLEATPSFLRCLRGLSQEQKAGIWLAMRGAAEAYGNPHQHAGLGLRRIGDWMECRDALEHRLLFQREGASLVFHFYGTHDQVRAFLRNRR